MRFNKIASRPWAGSEAGAAAELELLHAVELTLGERHGVVEAQRTEGRGPDQADTDRGTDDLAVVIHQARTGPGAIGRRLGRPHTAPRPALLRRRRRRFAGERPRRRALVVVETTGVGIDRAL